MEKLTSHHPDLCSSSSSSSSSSTFPVISKFQIKRKVTMRYTGNKGKFPTTAYSLISPPHPAGPKHPDTPSPIPSSSSSHRRPPQSRPHPASAAPAPGPSPSGVDAQTLACQRRLADGPQTPDIVVIGRSERSARAQRVGRGALMAVVEEVQLKRHRRRRDVNEEEVGESLVGGGRFRRYCRHGACCCRASSCGECVGVFHCCLYQRRACLSRRRCRCRLRRQTRCWDNECRLLRRSRWCYCGHSYRHNRSRSRRRLPRRYWTKNLLFKRNSIISVSFPHMYTKTTYAP